jgi:hypothetical protein
MNEVKNYNCTKELLYTISRGCWNSCNDYQTDFAAFKALYTPEYIASAIQAVNDARALPDSRQAVADRRAARVALADAAYDVKLKWQTLKAYIMQAYPKNVAPAMLEGAGASLYKKAGDNNWSTVRSLIDAANTFMANNLDALTADGNMPVGFPVTFSEAGISFINLSVTFFEMDNAKKMIVNQKIEANNVIYASVIIMLKDGQQIFKEDVAVKKLFVFDQQLATRKGAGSASFSGNIKNESKLPVVGASIVSSQLGYQAITNAKGHFSIKRMAAGDYTFTISFPGYAPLVQQVSLIAGVATKVDITLATAMKKVA